jgi:O-methyltransferase
MIKRTISSLVSNLGYELRRKNLPLARRGLYPAGYNLEQEAYENILKIHTHTMVTYERLVTLYQQAVFCETNNVRGSFVECGTWKGGSVGLMALANLKYGSARRHLHLFDSFEGPPEPDETVDGEQAIREAREVGGGTGGKLVALSVSVGPLEANKDLLERVIGYDASYLHYHKGWFQDTLPAEAAEVGEIAILRLDGDWYASTKICLESLYDQVVSGGFVIIDDYGAYDGCRKAVDEFMSQQPVKAFLSHLDYSGRYWIKP